MRKPFAALAMIAVLTLSACGTTGQDRALSGAGLGAGSGFLLGVLLSAFSAGTGTLVGAAIGAGTGYFTDAEDINLGQPIWK